MVTALTARVKDEVACQSRTAAKSIVKIDVSARPIVYDVSFNYVFACLELGVE